MGGRVLVAAVAFAAALSVSACGAGPDSADMAGRTPSSATAPANGPAAPLPPSQPAAAAAPEPPEPTEWSLTFIATGDDGVSGPRIGCGDSAVSVPVTTTTIAPLGEVMRAQLAEKDTHLGQSGLYNALAQSELNYDSATIVHGHATVWLSGHLSSGGICDIPRITEQLTAPALQFDNVDSVTVLINGEPLDELLALH